jgi:single-strand DNA-binding protein
MAKDLNKVQLIGRLGQDPELKYTQSGVAVVNFSMATSMQWKDQDGNKQEKTEWHNIVAWRGLAETCANYLKKGSKIYVEGRLETDTWEDENKKKHYKTKVLIDDLIMLDNKGTGGSTEGNGTAASTSSAAASTSEAKDDDLPF